MTLNGAAVGPPESDGVRHDVLIDGYEGDGEQNKWESLDWSRLRRQPFSKVGRGPYPYLNFNTAGSQRITERYAREELPPAENR